MNGMGIFRRMMNLLVIFTVTVCVPTVAFGEEQEQKKSDKNTPQQEAKFVASPITLDVEGMTCNRCAARIQKVLSSRKGVNSANVSYEKKSAIITVAEGGPSSVELIKAVEEAGFQATLVKELVHEPVVMLGIEGMTCNACAVGIQKALVSLEGVESAKVSYSDRLAVIKVSEKGPTSEELIKVIEKAGFKGKPVEKKNSGKDEKSSKKTEEAEEPEEENSDEKPSDK